MKNIDRRQWLKSAGLGGSFFFLGGLEAMALDTPSRPLLTGKIAQLNSNENPYGPSKRVRTAITNTFDDACRYPFMALPQLVDMIAEKEGVTKDHIVVTGGSTEGLKAAGLTFGIGGGEIIAADPTYQALLRYAETFGTYIHRVPVNQKWNMIWRLWLKGLPVRPDLFLSAIQIIQPEPFWININLEISV